MGTVTPWHLRQGFQAYLQARDVERLNSLVQVVEGHIAQAGSADGLMAGRLDMRSLLDELALREEVAGAGERRSSPPQGWKFDPPRDRPQDRPQDRPHDRPRDRQHDRPQGPPPHPPPHPPRPALSDASADLRQHLPPLGDRFGSRVALFAPDGSPLLPGKLPWIELPVLLVGRVVALVRLRPAGQAPDESEVRFLRKQYLGIAGVVAALLLLALTTAWWLARQ